MWLICARVEGEAFRPLCSTSQRALADAVADRLRRRGYFDKVVVIYSANASPSVRPTVVG